MTGRNKRKKSKVLPETDKKKEAKQIPEQEKVAPPPAKIPKPDQPPTQAETPAPAVSRPPRGPQCFNCQRWGHRSFNCQFDTRCVKCGQAHRAADCLKKKEDPPTCALCAGPHPASYRGCKLAPKTRRRRRPQPRRSQPDPSERGPLKKLLQVICKLLIKKDFFTEAQLAIIQEELDEKPATSEASTQTEKSAVFLTNSRETGKAEDPQPLPMETSPAPQAPPTQITSRTVETSTDDLQPEPMETVTESSTVKTNSTWSQTEPSRSNSVASQTPRDRAPPTQHKTTPSSSTKDDFDLKNYAGHPIWLSISPVRAREPEIYDLLKHLLPMNDVDQLKFLKKHYPDIFKMWKEQMPEYTRLCKEHRL